MSSEHWVFWRSRSTPDESIYESAFAMTEAKLEAYRLAVEKLRETAKVLKQSGGGDHWDAAVEEFEEVLKRANSAGEI